MSWSGNLKHKFISWDEAFNYADLLTIIEVHRRNADLKVMVTFILHFSYRDDLHGVMTLDRFEQRLLQASHLILAWNSANEVPGDWVSLPWLYPTDEEETR